MELDKETLEEIWLMVRSLVKTPPIFYDEDEQSIDPFETEKPASG